MRTASVDQNGFTLIELITVAAIIVMLTVVAIPAYQHYVVRAKLAEVLIAASVGDPARVFHMNSPSAGATLQVR